MKFSKKIISVLLTVIMLFSISSTALTSSAVYGDGDPNEVISSLSFAAISDIHYYPQSYTGNNCEAWQEFNTMASKEFQESFEKHIREENFSYGLPISYLADDEKTIIREYPNILMVTRNTSLKIDGR